MDRVTIVCFLASYAAALGLELLYQVRPLRGVRWLALTFGAAGLAAQTIFLAVQRPPLIWQYGWMLFLAWILAVFYLVGSVHHRRLSWGLFVLPLVLGLVGLGAAFGRPAPPIAPPETGGVWGGPPKMCYRCRPPGGSFTVGCCCWPPSACASASWPV